MNRLSRCLIACSVLSLGCGNVFIQPVYDPIDATTDGADEDGKQDDDGTLTDAAGAGDVDNNLDAFSSDTHVSDAQETDGAGVTDVGGGGSDGSTVDGGGGGSSGGGDSGSSGGSSGGDSGGTSSGSSGGDAGSNGGDVDATTGGCTSDKECGQGSIAPSCLRHACIAGACKLVNETNGTACAWNGKIPTCQESTCQQGACKLTTSPNGTVCNSKCTIKSGLNVWASSVCKAGACKEQPAENCDDGAPCTKDSCHAANGCKHVTIKGFCDDYNACTKDVCDPVAGCQSTHNKEPCDDGDKCTKDDKCLGGGCIGGVPTCACKKDADCASPNACRTAFCGDNGKCETKAAPQKTCDDKSSCTSADHCDAVGNCVGTKKICTDGVACTTDLCDIANGCQYLPDHPSCDDGNPCTTSQCLKAGCKYGDNDGADCDDGNKCTTPSVCKGNKCANGAPKTCFDANTCTSDSCDPATGKCIHKPLKDGAACNDGDQCTLNDKCGSGKCAGKGDCNDGNTCTKDSCNPKAGCAHTPTDGAKCSDGDPCTTGGTCSGKTCKPTGTKKCNDNNPCTIDSCVSGKGCQAEPGNNGAACGGGTTTQACKAGKCGPFKTPAGASWVKASTFLMGCNTTSDTQCKTNEKPGLTVKQTGFFVDNLEVTAQKYKFCVLAGKCTDAVAGKSGATYNNNAKQDHPINYVKWSQAKAYCTYKNGRLCTESEWELAARGPVGLVYPWGNGSPTCKLAMYSGCGAGTVKADSFAKGASPFGAQNMAGNVREWVADWYDAGWYGMQPGKKATDPTGPKNGTTRVVRGGFYGSGPTQIRTSARGFVGPNVTSASIGFRCCYDF